jgi:hypothetical protein
MERIGLVTALYAGIALEGRHQRLAQVVLFVRSVCTGEPSACSARELKVSRQSALQPRMPLSDTQTETDEMFQNAEEKRWPAQ